MVGSFANEQRWRDDILDGLSGVARHGWLGGLRMTRPLYCPCKYETPDPCPACGATVSGKDPVRGVCQALRGSEPKPLVELVTYRKGSSLDPDYAEASKE